ncbi:glycerol-3-phosphate acyltransferase PlsY [Eubacterium ruminantium]|nr:glycerol-3-phosphate acyltransferase PlsY [Eubacterium ruminantium]
MTVFIRIACIICGYFCGLLETGYIYGKIKGIDIRNYGSGNSGTTNALRVLGKKAGLVVFIGDFFKAVIPCLIVRLLTQNSYPDIYLLFVLYIGLGVVMGHNFPFYLKFKGGKGVAATAGMIVGLLIPLMILILLVLFVAVVALTRYVSLGSILLMIGFVTLYVIFAFKGMLCFDPSGDSRPEMIESIVLAVIFASMSIYKHKANIKRLLRGEENKLGQKKTEETIGG